MTEPEKPASTELEKPVLEEESAGSLPQSAGAVVSREASVRRPGLLMTLGLAGLLLLVFIGLTIGTIVGPGLEESTMAAEGTPTATPLPEDGPLAFAGPSTMSDSRLLLPEQHYMLYEQLNDVYLVPMMNKPDEGTPTPTPDPKNKPRALQLPGYRYNRSAPPLLTPGHQLLYSGDGIWLDDVLGGTPRQIEELAEGQTITSMVLGSDGKTVAWSTAPTTGSGLISIYMGRLDGGAQVVYQQQSQNCPCLRVFSLLNGGHDDAVMLLTDDRGDHAPAEFGLWELNLAHGQGQPVQILPADPQQGPLVLNEQGTALLYSDNKMVVPVPNDHSVPAEVASEHYANSLYLASLSGAAAIGAGQQVLPSQKEQSNIAKYRWIATPTFSPGGETLVYVVFASDGQDPYSRHSSLYTVHLSERGTQVQASKPQLLATTTARLIELGPWLDSHTLTFFADGWIYALDIQGGVVATITNTAPYARIIGML